MFTSENQEYQSYHDQVFGFLITALKRTISSQYIHNSILCKQKINEHVGEIIRHPMEVIEHAMKAIEHILDVFETLLEIIEHV